MKQKMTDAEIHSVLHNIHGLNDTLIKFLNSLSVELKNGNITASSTAEELLECGKSFQILNNKISEEIEPYCLEDMKIGTELLKLVTKSIPVEPKIDPKKVM